MSSLRCIYACTQHKFSWRPWKLLNSQESVLQKHLFGFQIATSESSSFSHNSFSLLYMSFLKKISIATFHDRATRWYWRTIALQELTNQRNYMAFDLLNSKNQYFIVLRIFTHQWMFELLERWAVDIFLFSPFSHHFHVARNKYLKRKAGYMFSVHISMLNISQCSHVSW